MSHTVRELEVPAQYNNTGKIHGMCFPLMNLASQRFVNVH